MAHVAVVENAKPRPGARRELSTVAASASHSAIERALKRDGAVIVSNLLSPEAVDRINSELDPVLAGPQLGAANDYLGKTTRRINSTLRHSPTIANKVVTHPALLEVATSILCEYCDHPQLNVAQVAEVAPGEPAQHLHRDDRMWGPIKGRVHPLSVVSIIALTEFTPYNGATRVVPGSHAWDDAYDASVQRYAIGEYEELATSASMPAGSAVTCLGTTLHGAGANRSTDVYRRGLVVNYCVGWMRTEANNFLVYPPDFARTLPEPVQRLLGYQLEAEHCGELEIGEDPIVLLR